MSISNWNVIKQRDIEILDELIFVKRILEKGANTRLVSKEIGVADVDLDLFSSTTCSNSGLQILQFLCQLLTLGLQLVLFLHQLRPLALDLLELLLLLGELLTEQQAFLHGILKA